MTLIEKFQERVNRASSIEDCETILRDLGNMHGVRPAEEAQIRAALEARMLVLADEPAEGVDAVVEEVGQGVVQEMKQEREAVGTLAVPAVTLESEAQIEAVVRHFHLFDRLKSKLLNPERDVLYIGKDGKPVPYDRRGEAASDYVRRSGWLKLATAFGLDIASGEAAGLKSWREERRDGVGPYYVCFVPVRVSHPSGKSVETVGVCSSRDPFFAKRGKEWIEPDEKNIWLKAETVGINRGVSALVGGGVPSAEEVEA